MTAMVPGLNRRAGEGVPRTQACEGADRSLTTDDGGVDRLPVLHDGHERHHAVHREIDVGDRGFLLLQNRASRKAGRAQVRREQRVIGRFERRQQPIFKPINLIEHRRPYPA
jgi:hypothetical protein